MPPPPHAASDSARPTVGVVYHSDSFSAVWPELAAAAESDTVTIAADGAVPPHLLGVIVACAGAETEAIASLPELTARFPGTEIVLVSGAGSHRHAVDAVRSGATDFYVLPSDVALIRSWLQSRAALWRAKQATEPFLARQRAHLDRSRLIGESAAWREVLARTEQVIPVASVPVLLTGETGTGKELLARAIHYEGSRAAGPFVELNCAALPANLIEAEVFGYEKGAFTDARASKPGLFEAAAGGTLFLDEIGELAPELQAKLLKVLEDKQVRRLGGVRSVPVDVRVIAATHVDLARRVKEGSFRRDLYYRLSVATLRLPPLRERGEDVLLIAEHFLDRLAAEFEVPRPRVTDPVRRALLQHAWPGNVRELRNSITRALLFGRGTLTPSLLFEDGAEDLRAGIDPVIVAYPSSLDQAARVLAADTLLRCGGNKVHAARVLGISRKKLYQLLGHATRQEKP